MVNRSASLVKLLASHRLRLDGGAPVLVITQQDGRINQDLSHQWRSVRRAVSVFPSSRRR